MQNALIQLALIHFIDFKKESKMRTIEGSFSLNGQLQDLEIPNHLFLEIDNTSGGNLVIKINDGAERTYESGSSYQTPVFAKYSLFQDEIKVRGIDGETIKYSYILPD